MIRDELARYGLTEHLSFRAGVITAIWFNPHGAGSASADVDLTAPGWTDLIRQVRACRAVNGAREQSY